MADEQRSNATGEPGRCPGRLRNGPDKRSAYCDLCGTRDYEGNEGDPCAATRPGRLSVLWECPCCGGAGEAAGACACGDGLRARYSVHAIETCEECGRRFFAPEGTPVITDPGDRTSPPDGYWLCQSCADDWEAREQHAREQYDDEDHYRRPRGQNPLEDH